MTTQVKSKSTVFVLTKGKRLISKGKNAGQPWYSFSKLEGDKFQEVQIDGSTLFAYAKPNGNIVVCKGRDKSPSNGVFHLSFTNK